MKAIFVLTLCVLVTWMTAPMPEPALAMAESATPPDQAALADNPEFGGDAVLGAALVEARGGWWNWVLKILRAILDVLPGGDDDPAEDPQT